MLVALAVANRGQHINRDFLRQSRQGGAEKNAIDERVGGQRKMRPVLLDGGGGQYQHARVTGQRGDLLPGEISEVAVVGDPAFHRADASTGTLANVAIFPGFSNPFAS